MMAQGQNINVQSILEKIIKKSTPPQGLHGCTIWRGATCNRGLYGQMRNPCMIYTNTATVTVHRLVYLLHKLEDYPDYNLPHFDVGGEALHVSHICHNSLCTNIHHLCFERQSINNERHSCKTQNLCTKLHVPACLL